MDAELYVVHVDRGVDDKDKDLIDQKLLDANIHFAEDLGAKVMRLSGKNIADKMAELAKEKHITQVIFGRSAVKGIRKLLYLFAISLTASYVKRRAVDVHIVSARRRRIALKDISPCG